jgi:hypothetical protein
VRLITFALLGTVALALLVGAAILYGLGQPPSNWAALLRLDDCQLPCWVGIQPGTTTLEQARERVRLAFGDSPAYTLEDFGNWQFAVTDRRSHYRIGITLDASNDPSGERQTVPPTVQQILLWADVVPTQRVSLRDLYGSLGTPEDLQLTWIGSAPYLMILYRQDRVGLATNALGCYSISPAQKIYQIIISARSLGDYFGWVSSPAPWLGFRRCHDLRLPITS